MRRFLASLLILLLLFNVLGCYALFLGLLQHTSEQMTQRLDSHDYSTAETITLKIPMTLAYGPGSREVERVDGQFEYKGEFYRLLEQKMVNDVLYVICVKDQQTKKIHTALTDYVNTFTDRSDDSSSNARISFEFCKDYFSPTFAMGNLTQGWNAELTMNPTVVNLNSSFSLSILLPPEQV